MKEKWINHSVAWVVGNISSDGAIQYVLAKSGGWCPTHPSSMGKSHHGKFRWNIQGHKFNLATDGLTNEQRDEVYNWLVKNGFADKDRPEHILS